MANDNGSASSCSPCVAIPPHCSGLAASGLAASAASASSTSLYINAFLLKNSLNSCQHSSQSVRQSMITGEYRQCNLAIAISIRILKQSGPATFFSRPNFQQSFLDFVVRLYVMLEFCMRQHFIVVFVCSAEDFSSFFLECILRVLAADANRSETNFESHSAIALSCGAARHRGDYITLLVQPLCPLVSRCRQVSGPEMHCMLEAAVEVQQSREASWGANAAEQSTQTK